MKNRMATPIAGVAFTVAAFIAAGASAVSDDALTLDGDGTTAHAAFANIELPENPTVSLAILQDEAPADPNAWEGKFIASGAGTFGNTDTQSVSALATTRRERETDITTFDASYFTGLTDGDRTDDNASVGWRTDWLLPDSDWFIFGQLRGDYDRFKEWEYRVSGSVGPGYTFVDEEDLTVNGRVGIGFAKEWKSPDNDFRGELLIGGDVRWQISEKAELIADATIYPNLDDSGEFRTLTNVAYSLLLDEESSMSFSAGLRHEYNSTFEDPVDKSDFRITAGIQFDF